MSRKLPEIINGIELWRCPVCKSFKTCSEFYKSKNTISGISSLCRKCHVAVSMRTRDVDKARLSRKLNARIQRLKNPEKVRARERKYRRSKTDVRVIARNTLNASVAVGIIKKPSRCNRCQKVGRICAHHEDYSKPLDVEWLCYECHAIHHRKLVTFRRVN